LKELLTDDGSIYVHLDWKMGHYVKVFMDEILGQENFLNEIFGFIKVQLTAVICLLENTI